MLLAYSILSSSSQMSIFSLLNDRPSCIAALGNFPAVFALGSFLVRLIYIGKYASKVVSRQRPLIPTTTKTLTVTIQLGSNSKTRTKQPTPHSCKPSRKQPLEDLIYYPTRRTKAILVKNTEISLINTFSNTAPYSCSVACKNQ